MSTYEYGLDKENIRTLHWQLEAVLQDWGKENGLGMKVGSLRYSKDGFRMTVEGAVLSGEVASFEKANFIRHCSKYGLTPEDFGREFTNGDGVYRICGIKTSNRKYPILAENVRRLSPDFPRVKARQM